jgi:hypothetical protein
MDSVHIENNMEYILNFLGRFVLGPQQERTIQVMYEERNIESRSCYHCFSIKTKILHILSVCLSANYATSSAKNSLS